MIFFLSALGLPISVKAKLSGRSRSSFYYKPKKPEKDRVLKDRITSVLNANPYYGHRRVGKALGVNHKRAYRVMRRFGIQSKSKRGRRRKNQYSAGKTTLPNLIKDMPIVVPNHVWAGDFTHFQFQRRTYYLATVMDACTREVIGWHIATNHSVELVAEALRMAIGKRCKAALIFHSDHGSEYISETYVSTLKRFGITPSNSQKGKPWQNGIQESFYHRFKQELGDLRRFSRIDKLIEALGHQFRYYNTTRIHSTLKMPPRAFYEQKMKEVEAQKTAN